MCLNEEILRYPKMPGYQRMKGFASSKISSLGQFAAGPGARRVKLFEHIRGVHRIEMSESECCWRGVPAVNAG